MRRLLLLLLLLLLARPGTAHSRKCVGGKERASGPGRLVWFTPHLTSQGHRTGPPRTHGGGAVYLKRTAMEDLFKVDLEGGRGISPECREAREVREDRGVGVGRTCDPLEVLMREGAYREQGFLARSSSPAMLSSELVRALGCRHGHIQVEEECMEMRANVGKLLRGIDR
ncbi:hypothetical protein INR49_003655 [Caranx melampygus]|nr:hypothetical protein INR49_003655 [Caranx melampygus]